MRRGLTPGRFVTLGGRSTKLTGDLWKGKGKVEVSSSPTMLRSNVVLASAALTSGGGGGLDTYSRKSSHDMLATCWTKYVCMRIVD